MSEHHELTLDCRLSVTKPCVSVQGYELRASIAFPALALFNLLRDPIRQLPDCITSLINARIAARRLQDFLHVSSLAYIILCML